MTAYSPLRSASSEFGKLSVALTALAAQSETFPIELVLGIPIYARTAQKMRSKDFKATHWYTNNIS